MKTHSLYIYILRTECVDRDENSQSVTRGVDSRFRGALSAIALMTLYVRAR